MFGAPNLFEKGLQPRSLELPLHLIDRQPLILSRASALTKQIYIKYLPSAVASLLGDFEDGAGAEGEGGAGTCVYSPFAIDAECANRAMAKETCGVINFLRGGDWEER